MQLEVTQPLNMFRPCLSRAFFISLLGPILGNPMVLEVIVMVTPVISRSARRKKPCGSRPYGYPDRALQRRGTETAADVYQHGCTHLGSVELAVAVNERLRSATNDAK